jgi:hypothetical protein
VELDRLVGENGTPMLVNKVITESEEQNGGDLCRFIAQAHASLIMDEK